MKTGRVDLRDVQSTMLVTLYLRALESRDANPILGDRFAADAVRRIDYDWTRLSKRSVTNSRYGVALRGRQLDDWAADFLSRHPDATVLHMACGLDSRAFRLDPPAGVRWFDVDLPDVIELRRKLYDESGNYRMIASSVTDSAWLDEIPTDKPGLIIAEGLLMYLRENEVRELLKRLTDHFPSGELIFDGVAPWMAKATQLLKKNFGRWYGDYPAYWTPMRDESDVERWNPRLRLREHVALVSRYERIPDPGLRRMYGLGSRFGWFRNFLRVFRAEF
ncbi:class I SAM-dependent methyltransferase [Kutzneria sp. CA-103260]|uniref:class I SAM-dependent methyltransferase n=1 Tax=Kutzneria sp. CA-103260 TaxID=2802641 RepID=UPI001BA7DAED|nr:class I SAM-dependent methyltransferase [Kutzneria sp. CA-103260]QUQ71351.1 Leucine carboxyl methyltransferase [Kutzneria sp. CA-103260]